MKDLTGIDYGNGDMTLEQIEKFIDQVEKSKTIFNQITLMGGEPLKHPKLGKIVKLINDRLIEQFLVKKFIIETNGTLPKPKKLEGYCRTVHPLPKVDWHSCIFVSPLDDQGFELGMCGIPDFCGISLNKYGYMAGSHCASLALLFGRYDLFKYELPNGPKDFEADMKDLCKHCQYAYWQKDHLMFKKPFPGRREKNYGRMITKTYQEAFDKIKKEGFKEPKLF
jgi:hypothetical protein